MTRDSDGGLINTLEGMRNHKLSMCMFSKSTVILILMRNDSVNMLV